MAGDVKVAVVSGRIASDATGTADFTKAGFGTPKVCIILLSFDAADDGSVAAEGKFSIGFSDFGGQVGSDRVVSFQDEDASAKVDSDAIKSNIRCYSLLAVNGAPSYLEGDAQAITDGVRLTNFSNDDAVSAFATVIMFGGTDLKFSLDRTTIASVNGNTATITPGAGFDTSLIFFIGADLSGEGNSSSGVNNSFGVCHINAPTYDTFIQRCMGWASDHNNAAGSPASVLRNDRCLKILTEVGGNDWGLKVTAAATNSITVTTLDAGAGAGMEVYSLALDIDDRKAAVGSVDSPISGATWTPSVALGFISQYVGLGVTHVTAENVIETGADAGGLGISSNTGVGEETFHGWYNEDAAAITNTNNNFRSRVLDFRNDDVTIVVHDHSHLSFNIDDWTTTINIENETIARKWMYWAIEEAAAAGTTFFETPAMTAVGVVTFSKVVTFVKAPSMTAVGVASVVKKIEKTLAITAIGVPAVAKQIEKTIAMTALGVVTFVKGLLFQQQPAMTAVGVVALQKTVGKTLAITAVGVASVAKTISKTIAITAVGVPSVVKQIEKTIAITATGVASLTKGLLFERSAAMTAVGIAGFSKTLIAVVSPAMTALGVVTLAKTIRKTIAITAVGVASLGKTIRKTISITASGVVTFSKVFTPGGPAVSAAKRLGVFIGMRLGL